MHLQDYYTNSEFARLIGVSPATTIAWRKKGKITPVHIAENGYAYYSKQQLAEVLESRGVDITGINSETPGAYMIKCWECGTLMPRSHDKAINRVMCDECRIEYEASKKKILQKYIELKMLVMYERALRMMEKSEKVDMCEIEEAAKAVKGYSLKNYDAFDSSQEMIAAIVLINSRITVKMQHQVGNKKLDIYLPGMNCGVEVDGKFHHGKEVRDSKRDITIRSEMGKGFEIVRIPVKYIQQNPMQIPNYIKEALKLKRQLREHNNGVLPDNFSKREKELYKNLM